MRMGPGDRCRLMTDDLPGATTSLAPGPFEGRGIEVRTHF